MILLSIFWVTWQGQEFFVEFRIREYRPFVKNSYPVPYSKWEAVQKLNRMSEGHILVKLVSPYSNSTVIVIKKVWAWFMLGMIMFRC